MFIFVMIGSILFLFFIDCSTKPIIVSYINTEVERMTTNIINLSIDKLLSKNEVSDNLLMFDGNNYYYNTSFMNELSSKATSFFYAELDNLEAGEVDEYFISKRIKNSKYNKVKNGILCDISFASLRNSTLFSNIGPSIPIRLLFLGDVNTDYDFEVSEYGINNVLIKVFFVVNVREQISMPFSSKKKSVVVRRLVSMNMINGKIPDFLTSYAKK